MESGNMQFTAETESEEKLHFLDVLLQPNLGGTLLTTIYRKSTHADRYLDLQHITA